jgi:hypothetical protein
MEVHTLRVAGDGSTKQSQSKQTYNAKIFHFYSSGDGRDGAETVRSKIELGRNLSGKRIERIFQILSMSLTKHVTGQKKAQKMQGSLDFAIANTQNIAQKWKGRYIFKTVRIGSSQGFPRWTREYLRRRDSLVNSLILIFGTETGNNLKRALSAGTR